MHGIPFSRLLSKWIMKLFLAYTIFPIKSYLSSKASNFFFVLFTEKQQMNYSISAHPMCISRRFFLSHCIFDKYLRYLFFLLYLLSICAHIEHNSDKCYWQINYTGFTHWFGCTYINTNYIWNIRWISSTNCFHVSLSNRYSMDREK